ncbi:MAG TPA: hypothetical protein VH370_03195 [Humisphaera sp.]|nr:hypothetical protein [Humisphaera sp.]
MKLSGHLNYLVAALSIAALFIAGCDREDPIRAYQAPKETVATDQPSMADMGAASARSSANDLADLRWTLPGDWQLVQTPDDPKAIFHADARIAVDPGNPQLLLSVSHLSGDAPGARSTLMNVNRWEGQAGLPPSTESTLPSVVTNVQVGDLTVSLVDLKNNGKQLLGAIVPHADRTWFFKLEGPDQQIGPHQAQFDQFIRSLHFEQAAPAQQQPQVSPPQVSPPQASQAQPPPGVQWQIPAGWTAQPTTPMLLALLQAGDGGAIVKISSFGINNYGGLKDNLDRWRRDVGLPPTQAAEVSDAPETQIGGRAWKIFDFIGPESAGADRKRSIVAQTRQGDNVYFFKIYGPATAVTQQKAAFDQFVASVKIGT